MRLQQCCGGGYSFFSLVLLLFYMSGRCFCFILNSSNSSFVQFEKWNVALNGSLEFEFKTQQSNGLLLYTDDGGTYDFFEIKLVEGALRLRYNLGSGAQILTVGRELNDGKWHKVTVKRDGEKTVLTVDDITHSKITRGKEFHFGNISKNSDVYMGGLPTWYNTKLTRLALPSVIFEPRFGGVIRNLIYLDADSNTLRRQRIKRSSTNYDDVDESDAVERSNDVFDVCETDDPCENNGICITTDDGPVCNCKNLDYEGRYCEKEKTPSEASFFGEQFLLFDASRQDKEVFVSTEDTVSFYFKTSISNGLLFHSSNGEGDKEDYLSVAIKAEGITVLMKISSIKFSIIMNPNKIRFNDLKWHKVVLHRKIKDVTLTIDDTFVKNGNIAGSFTTLSTSQIYIGGIGYPWSGVRNADNFNGCIRKVMYGVGGMNIDIIDFAKTENTLTSIHGNVSFSCKASSSSDGVTFTTPESFLVLPNWEVVDAGSFSITFRTNELQGLLVYNGPISSTNSDLFAIELFNGSVYVIMDSGFGSVKEQIGYRKVNDNIFHTINLIIHGKNVRVSMDGIETEFIIPGEPKMLNLGNGIFIGGLPWHNYNDVEFSPVLWTATLRNGFVGCIREVVINDQSLDLMRYVEDQDSVSVQPACVNELQNHCIPNPCFNYGECINGYNRFICECNLTDFIGSTCSRISPVLVFNGSQYMNTNLQRSVKYQVEDLTVRFKTTRENGLLFATTHESGDFIEMALFAGKIRMIINIGGVTKIMVNSHNLGDNVWHTAHYVRYLDHITLTVDNRPPSKGEGIFLEHSLLNVQHIHTGGYALLDLPIPASVSKTVMFTGVIQKLFYNGRDFIHGVKIMNLKTADDSARPIIKSTSTYNSGEKHYIIHQPFTFASKNTFVGLEPLKLYSSISIYFQFRTKEPNGLIFYNGGKGQDYFALELIAGRMHVYIQTKAELLRIKDELPSALNDNHWHAVSIEQIALKVFILYIDNIVVSITRYSSDPIVLSGVLYVGGVPHTIKSSLPKQLHSIHGYHGCLANIHLNGESPDLIKDAVIPSTMVATGCEGTGKVCNSNACENGGICVQQWNTQFCDCGMTSFSGPTCTEFSVAFEFGPGRGVITYTYPEEERPEMKSDTLALGFKTMKDDAVIIRVDSATSNDYMELEIVEGNIFMVYNMGTQDIPIGETSVKVNDNKYHVVKFTRFGSNSTLQLDDLDMQYNHPTGIGSNLQVFNSQSTIQVGGKWNRSNQRIERPFGGLIAGLVFNGIRILDLSHERHHRTERRGDITKREILTKKTPDNSLNFIPTSITPISEHAEDRSDDLVFSGAGSCELDDEDHCKVVIDHNSDDIVTAVYISSTRRTSTIGYVTEVGKPFKVDDDGKPGDDEEDYEGSGEIDENVDGVDTAVERNEVMGTVESIIPVDQDTTTANSTAPAALTTFGSQNITLTPIVTVVGVSIGTSIEPNTTVVKKISDMFNELLHKVSKEVGKSISKKITTSTSTVKPTAPTTIPYYVPLPPVTNIPILPEIITRRRPTEGPKISSPTSKEASLAYTIIIICSVLIVIIVVIIFILLFGKKANDNYKIDSKSYSSYQQEQRSVLLPPTSGQQFDQGRSITGNNNNKIKKRQDVKEWYV